MGCLDWVALKLAIILGFASGIRLKLQSARADMQRKSRSGNIHRRGSLELLVSQSAS